MPDRPVTLGLLAALPRELGRLRAPPGVVVAAGGMGADRAAAAARRMIADHGLGLLLSVGFAAALTSDLAPGDAVTIGWVTDDSGVRLEATCGGLRGTPVGCLTTATPLLTAGAKQAAAASGAAVAEMETFAVAGVARELGVAWAGVRGVTDGFGEDLPAVVAAGDELAVALAALGRPTTWPALWRLAGRSRRAAAALAAHLEPFLESWR